MFLAQSKKNSFSSHPPTAHGSIFLHFCTKWRTFVYGRRSNLIKALLVFLGLCSYWYCAAVFHSAIFFFFFFSLFPTSYVIFIMLFILFLNKSPLWKDVLARSYSMCAWAYGWKAMQDLQECDWQCDDVSGGGKVENEFVACCYSPFFFLREGRGLQF